MLNNPKIERTRYIALTYGYNRTLTQQELWKLISSSCYSLFGTKGLIKMGLYLHYSSSNPFAIFRVSLNSVDNFLMGLAFCREFDKQPIVIFSLEISGTIKGLKNLEKSLIIKKLIEINAKR